MSLPSIVRRAEAAYKKTGYKPVDSFYYGERAQCCPLGAIALAEGIVNSKMNNCRRGKKVEGWAENNFGEEYTVGFTNGFDGVGVPTLKTGYDTNYLKGLRHGAIARRRLLKNSA